MDSRDEGCSHCVTAASAGVCAQSERGWRWWGGGGAYDEGLGHPVGEGGGGGLQRTVPGPQRMTQDHLFVSVRVGAV